MLTNVLLALVLSAAIALATGPTLVVFCRPPECQPRQQRKCRRARSQHRKLTHLTGRIGRIDTHDRYFSRSSPRAN